MVIGPVVAPAGTSTKTDWLEVVDTGVAGDPLKLTDVVPSRFVPHNRICFPGAPAVGETTVNAGVGGVRPVSKTKTVPCPFKPPDGAVP